MLSRSRSLALAQQRSVRLAVARDASRDHRGPRRRLGLEAVCLEEQLCGGRAWRAGDHVAASVVAVQREAAFGFEIRAHTTVVAFGSESRASQRCMPKTVRSRTRNSSDGFPWWQPVGTGGPRDFRVRYVLPISGRARRASGLRYEWKRNRNAGTPPARRTEMRPVSKAAASALMIGSCRPSLGAAATPVHTHWRRLSQ
jgi:hypothetical protein